MWRSVSISARRSGWRLWSLRNQSQVLPKTPSPKPSHSHSSSPTFPPNPRFFSHSSLHHTDLESDEQSPSDAHNIDGIAEFGETHVAIFPETEQLGVGLDEIGGKNDDESVDQIIEESSIDVEKIEEVLSLLQSSVDETLESSLGGLKLSLSEEFVLRVARTPGVPGGHLIRFFRWATEKERVPITTPVVDAIVRGVCGGDNVRRNDVYAVWDLVKEIGERKSGLLNAEILNGLISAFSRLGKGKAAYEVFNGFEGFGCVLNADSYYFTVKALCRRSIYNWGWSVAHKMIDAGTMPTDEKIGQIMSLFCKGKKAKEAHLIYVSAKGSGRCLPQTSVKFLIGALARVDETVGLALEMLDDLSPEARKRAITQYYHVVQGLCRTKSVGKAKELLQKMVEAGPPPGNPVFNSVICSLSKAGDLDDAVATLRLMQKRGLKPDVYTYSVIMCGYAKGGQMDEACELLKEAKKGHSKLCPTTVHTLIRGYCKLEDYDKAVKLLSQMKNYGVEPNVDEYNKLIQSLCLEALDWRRAEKLLEQMKKKGLFLPGITRGLINAVKEMEQEALAKVEATVEA